MIQSFQAQSHPHPEQEQCREQDGSQGEEQGKHWELIAANQVVDRVLNLELNPGRLGVAFGFLETLRRSSTTPC